MILSAQESVNIEAIETHLQVLRKTEYRVKSAHGVSPNFVKCMTNLLILGLLQVSAAVSIMWTMLSTLALTVLSLRSLPAHFYTPQIETYTKRQGEAFVDNTTLWTTSYTTTCIVTIVARAAIKAQAWAQIIFVCGGWLNLKKCYWYAISWRFKPTGEAIMETISDNPNLKISITQKGQPPKTLNESK
jgi:hypothetical protein